MKALTTCALLCACVAGCVQAPTYPQRYQVYIDPAFSPSDTDRVFAALDIWQNAVDIADNGAGDRSNLQFDVMIRDYTVTDSDNATITIHPDTRADIDKKAGGPDYIGVTTLNIVYGGRANVYVVAGFSSKSILHELGHSFGLVHTGYGTILCQGESCQADTVTTADAVQYCTLRGICQTSKTP